MANSSEAVDNVARGNDHKL